MESPKCNQMCAIFAKEGPKIYAAYSDPLVWTVRNSLEIITPTELSICLRAKLEDLTK